MNNKSLHKILWTILIIQGIIFTFSALTIRFQVDEMESIHAASNIARGLRIYVDFFEHHHPFLYYLLSPIVYLCGESYWTLVFSRALMLLMAFVTIFLTYKMAVLLFNKTSALISAIFLCSPPFALYGVEVRPDVPQVLFSMAAFYILFLYIKKKKITHVYIAGFFLGISFLFLQKAIFSIFLSHLVLGYLFFKKEINIKNIMVFEFMILFPLITYSSLFLIFSGTFKNYFLCNWIFNLSLPREFKMKYFFQDLITTYKLNPYFLFFFSTSIFFKKTFLQRVIFIFPIFLVATICLYKINGYYYVLPALPFIAILASNSFNMIFEKNQKLLIFSIIVLLGHSCFMNFFNIMRIAPISNQWKILKKISLQTSDHDFCTSGRRPDPNSSIDYFFNIFKKDVSYMGFFELNSTIYQTYEKLTKKKQEDNILQIKPKFITKEYLSCCCSDESKIFVENNYKQSDIDEVLLVRVDS
jgi:4-amino-4-deoxy-L-arabinose transferase-like glycosyltransferase